MKEQQVKKKQMKTYTANFKKEAINLAERIGFSKASEALEVPCSTLHGWKSFVDKSSSSQVFKKRVPKTSNPMKKELKKLKKEIEEEQEVIEMLKEALIFFSKQEPMK